MLLRTSCVSRVIVGSFSDRVIVRFREVLPDVPTTAGKNEAAVFYLLSRFGLDASRPLSGKSSRCRQGFS